MEGIATNKPKAVTNSASAIPGATTAKLVFWAIAIAWKLFIIPHTVPNKPIKGATDPEEAKKHVLNMVKNQSLNCHSGKQIPCEIDSVCIHGDNVSALATASSIKDNLKANKLLLKPLNLMEKFI